MISIALGGISCGFRRVLVAPEGLRLGCWARREENWVLERPGRAAEEASRAAPEAEQSIGRECLRR